MSAGTYTPEPGGRAALPDDRGADRVEIRMLLRNGEQLLLTMIIPALLLVALLRPVDRRHWRSGKAVDFLAPGVLALAVMSTAFTGQAIATGFERRYGVLKRLGATPLPRWALLTAKTLLGLVTEVLQIVLLTVVAFALGWSPHGNPLAVLLLLVLGTAAFSGLGLLMAGSSKAEATLAAANLVFLLLLVGGGVILPLDKFPDAVQTVLGCCRSPRCRTGCATCSSTAPGCRGATWASSRCGRYWASGRPPGSSAGSSARGIRRLTRLPPGLTHAPV